MITILNLSKNFGQRLLIKDISLSIFPNEKIGLTGPNGTGKTTLFSIILGELEPSSGEVQMQKNLHIGYLPQEMHFHSKRTVLQELTSGDDRIKTLIAEKRALENANEAASMRYGDVLHELEQLGIYELEHRAEKVLSGLGFKESDFHRPVNTLSGGWQMRMLLAKLLTYEYDVLLLDEPTNYLDLPATLWIKDFLRNYKGTFVIISHDKVFLNDVTNYTIVLDQGSMVKVKGNYACYEQTREERLKTLEKKKKQIDKKRQQLERFTQRFHAQPNRAAAVRNKRKMIERMESIDLPQERRSIKDFEFPATVQSGYSVISLQGVAKSYGDICVYENLDFEVTRGEKICLVGPNGAGKSTLLKMLAGVIEPDGGRIRCGHQVESGYFSQARLDVLNPNNTAFDEVATAAKGNVPAVQIRSLLGLFNFRGDDVFKQVKVLSGGEKSRVILAKLLINPPNFILLDEPTTHLDIDGVEALTRAFKSYQGTLCMISHDLFFIQEVANYIIEVNQGQLKKFPGGLEYYLDKKKEVLGNDRTEERKRKKQEKRTDKKEKKESNPALEVLKKKHKEAVNRIKEIRTEIKNLEKEYSELETENYVKARVLSEPFKKRDPELLKEYGQRLKFIAKRVKEIEREIDLLKEEKERISKD